MEYPVNLVVTQLFDLNARIQQLTWSLIFYEKYSTSLLDLWFWPPLILGGSVISAGTIHDLRRVKVPAHFETPAYLNVVTSLAD